MLASLRCGGCEYYQSLLFTHFANVPSGSQLDHGFKSHHDRPLVERSVGTTGILPSFPHRTEGGDIYEPALCQEYR